MSKKIFPIQTSTSCRLKWSWSSLYLNTGKTASCHRAALSLIPDSFDDFHNTNLKVKHREEMLQGQWPGGGCEYCKNIEDVSGTSDRQFQNQIPDLYPHELDDNPTLTRVFPSILEVFFSNTCNLSCVYCKSSLSSSIQAENEKFNGAILPVFDFTYENNQYKNLVPKFWKWLSQNSNSLQRLQVLGGEPFLQKEVEQLVEFFISNPNPNLELNFITNLSLSERIILPHLEKLSFLMKNNFIKRLDIQVSIDCWTTAQEYIRHGINLKLFEQNIKHLLKDNLFRVGLLSTVTSLSIPGMFELAKKRNQWSENRELFWYVHLVLPAQTSIFDPTIFEYSLYESYIDQIYQILPNNTWDDIKTFELFNGIVKKLKNSCKTDIQRQKNLLDYLQKNDTRRNTNWKESFPWLEQEFEKNNVV